MATKMVNDIEAGNMLENRPWIRETLQTLRFLVSIGPPLLLFFVILVIVFNALLPKK
jgi:hypothetical protein